MEINIKTTEGVVNTPKGKPSVVISPNPTKTSVMVDQYGNEIDRRTKRIIKRNDEKQ